MAELVQCKVCGKSVSSEAGSCPHCGQKLSKKCVVCQQELNEGDLKCSNCGQPIEGSAGVKQESKIVLSSSNATISETSEKTMISAALLCFFLGSLGVHRFYVGKTGSGLGMLFTGGGCGIWALIDFIMILTGSFTDSENKPLKR